TGDMTPIEPTAQLHLREAKIIVEKDLIAKDGLILIDDVKSPLPKMFGEKSDLGKISKSSYGTGFRLVNASGNIYRADLASGDEGTNFTLIIQYPWTYRL
ncbi:MAG: hypothetical protein ACO3NG_10880, partial [bacterium]